MENDLDYYGVFISQPILDNPLQHQTNAILNNWTLCNIMLQSIDSVHIIMLQTMLYCEILYYTVWNIILRIVRIFPKSHV